MAQDKRANSDSAIDAWDPRIRALARADVRTGDPVVMWRPGRGGGVVGLGTVRSSTPSEDEIRRVTRAASAGVTPVEPPANVEVTLSFDRLRLGKPIGAPELAESGLGDVAKHARSARSVHWIMRTLSALELPPELWQRFVDLITDPALPTVPWPASWNIDAGMVVPKRQVHDVYGGNRSSPLTSSALTPNTLLFLTRNSSPTEISPLWVDGALIVPGIEDRYSISSENRAILTHVRRGIPLRVFERRGKFALYLGEFAVDQERPIERWVIAKTHDDKTASFYSENFVNQVPLLRLHQLDGVSAFADDPDLFITATRTTIGIQLTTTYPPDRQRTSERSPVNNADDLVTGKASRSTVHKLLRVLRSDPTGALTAAGIDEARALTTLIEQARRRTDLARLKAASEAHGTSEAELQAILENMTWIFGGDFLSGTARRRLTVLDQLDLSLIRPDGTLHGVEIKKAEIKNLVKRLRNHRIPGIEVHEAVNQAMNYLVSLDEQRHTILAEFGIDCRRASMTVVIGHSAFTAHRATPSEIAEILRTYASHMTRIDVVTYDQLVNRAERMLDLTQANCTVTSGSSIRMV
ncbi:Shedu anti-phage system protein SduA domain-containing protein [Embleya scabrispora]|uniref:Shedu anti-phage system protein SduA domain-containing protein n=1 Tax=Embleya scabrispora TaxID=159449 RepID=UPI001374CAC8|nr:Shedu anti-phage system protein SduA domain-containing protein [Embleya scabrispora]